MALQLHHGGKPGFDSLACITMHASYIDSHNQSVFVKLECLNQSHVETKYRAVKLIMMWKVIHSEPGQVFGDASGAVFIPAQKGYPFVRGRIDKLG